MNYSFKTIFAAFACLIFNTYFFINSMDPRDDLKSALINNNLQAIKEIISKHRNAYKFMCINRAGADALYYAVEHNYSEIAKYLISIGANVNTKPIFNISNSQSMLHLAMNHGDTELAKSIIIKGFYFEDMNKYWYYQDPLYIAIDKSEAELVKLMVEKGASVDRANSGETPIGLAMQRKNLEVIKILINAFNNINYVNKYGKSFLHEAVWWNNLAAADYLISQNIDLDIKDNTLKATAYDHALLRKNNKMIYLILKAQAHRAIYKTFIIKKIILAIKDKDTKRALLLIKLYPEEAVKFACSNGNTLLHIAASHGDTKVMENLLAIRPHLAVAKNNDGEIAMQIAAGDLEFVKVFLKAAGFIFNEEDQETLETNT